MTRSRKAYTTVSRGGTRISNDQPGRRALLFNQVQSPANSKNKFDLSHGVTMSGKMGVMIPTETVKAVPGDIHKVGIQPFLRMAPMIAPIMQQINCSFHTWGIPTRLLWDNFTKFIIGEGNHTMPYVTLDEGMSDDTKKLLDYLGIPPIPPGGTQTNICALPLAAYQFLYNEKYRDQNMIAEVDYKLIDGDNTANTDLFVLRHVAWEHDLFTSALPQASFGADVDIPLGDVVLKTLPMPPGSNPPKFVGSAGLPITGGNVTTSATIPDSIDSAGGSTDIVYDPQGTLETEATTIKELRRALKKQEFLELLARGGKRYYEVMQRLWDVETSDKTFQQPEWISGIKTPVVISEVLNTTGTDDLPQGNMAGHGISVGNGEGKWFFCEEYMYILTVGFVTPKSGYSQGIPKHFLELDYEEFGNFIQYEHIGEQELTDEEVFAYTPSAKNTWGYVPRYAHLKYMPDRIAGDMRTTLDHYHMARTFATMPSLNQTFIEVDPDDPSITRVFAVEDGSDYLYIDVWLDHKAVRPFSVFGNPQL